MKRCPVSRLPIREKPEWVAPHAENGYDTVFCLIGDDIIHFVHRSAKPEISLAGIDSRRFLTILKDLNLSGIPLYLIVNFEKVTDIEYLYSKNFLNFVFNWGRNIRVIVLYNVNNEIRNDLDRFCLIAPENVCMTSTGSYREAVEKILDMKKRKSWVTVEENPSSGSTELKKELLASMTRISLLHILNQQMHPPAPDHEFYPYFLAVEEFRKDMIAKDAIYRKKKIKLQEESERRRCETVSRLQQQISLHTGSAKEHEGRVTALKKEIQRRDEELQRLKIVEEKKSLSAEEICRRISALGRDDLLENIRQSHSGKKSIGDIADLKLSDEDSIFIEKLKRLHANLTENELHLCLLVRKKLTTKAIAQMYETSTRGMESIRYRLHTKLGLGKHLSIKAYLTGLR